MCRYSIGILILFLVGCSFGTLKKGLPFDRDLTPSEVLYARNQENKGWNYPPMSFNDAELHYGNSCFYDGPVNGDYNAYGFWPFYYSFETVGCDEKESLKTPKILVSDMYGYPFWIPLPCYWHGKAATFNGRTGKREAVGYLYALTSSPIETLMSYSSFWVDDKKEGCRYLFLLNLFDWGYNPEGWFARILLIPFGPGSSTKNKYVVPHETGVGTTWW